MYASMWGLSKAQEELKWTNDAYPINHGFYLTGGFDNNFPYNYGKWAVKNPELIDYSRNLLIMFTIIISHN